MRTVSAPGSARLPHSARLFGLAFCATLASAGCSEDGGASELPANPANPDAPIVRITSPERGAYVGDVSTVTVRGTATDKNGDASKLRSLAINGIPLELDADGGFRATVPISPNGTSLFTVEAVDLEERVGKVTHAFSAGRLTYSGTRIARGITTALSADAFTRLAAETSSFLRGGDLGFSIAPLNPVLDLGADCLLRANASVGALDMEDADVDLVPTRDGVTMHAVWTGVTIPMSLGYSVLCLAGDAELAATADTITITGRLDLGVKNGRFEVKLAEPRVTIDGLDLHLPQLPIIPPQVLSLLDLSNALGPILTKISTELQSPLLGGFLADLVGSSQVPVLGEVLNLDISVADLLTSDSRALIDLDALFEVDDAPGIPFVSLPSLAPVLDGGADRIVAMADNTVNSLLAGFLAGGGGDGTIEIPDDLSGLIRQVNVAQLLPLSINPNNGLDVVVPEVLLTFGFTDGTENRVAINGSVPLDILQRPDGTLRLVAGPPDLGLDFDTADLPLSKDQVAAVTRMATDWVHQLTDGVLGAVPLPSGLGTPLGNLELRGEGGFLIVLGDEP
jgi:Bacterial Ig domain